ncbi:MAG: helix-turn-helix domain-containing protein [Candidatus Cloacimonadota bacterium]|nr:helix-turn-helix domain-containing protein [Candidatus Cloacimonadota bacterium]
MPSIIKKLKEIGFTEYESRTYYHLLKKKYFTASEISRVAKVPRTRIYEILNTLTKKGFVTQIPGKVRKFSAISPEFAFQNMVLTLEQNFDQQKSEIKELSQQLLPIFDKQKENSDPLDYIEIVREPNRINEKMNELGEKTKNEIVTMNRAPYAVDFDKIVARGSLNYIEGIKYKLLAEKSDMENKNYQQFMRLWQQAGAKIRIAEEIPVKLAIFDNKTIILSLPDPISHQSSLTSMIIEHPDLAKFFRQIFDTYFQNAISLSQYLKM